MSFLWRSPCIPIEFICAGDHNHCPSVAMIRCPATYRGRTRKAKIATAMTTKKTRLASAQIRAARALLNWSMRQLSERSGVSQSAISRAERAKGCPTMHEQGLSAIKATLERFGVEFLDES